MFQELEQVKLDCEESWAPKNWCFWTVVLKTPEVPWTARRSNQSILKISPGCSLEELMLKLKLQYFGHLTRRADSLLGGIGGRRRRGRQRRRWLDGISDSMDVESQWTPAVGDGQGGLACCDSWGSKESDTTEWLNWTEPNRRWYGCECRGFNSTQSLNRIKLWQGCLHNIQKPLCANNRKM